MPRLLFQLNANCSHAGAFLKALAAAEGQDLHLLRRIGGRQKGRKGGMGSQGRRIHMDLVLDVHGPPGGAETSLSPEANRQGGL